MEITTGIHQCGHIISWLLLQPQDKNGKQKPQRWPSISPFPSDHVSFSDIDIERALLIFLPLREMRKRVSDPPTL